MSPSSSEIVGSRRHPSTRHRRISSSSSGCESLDIAAHRRRCRGARPHDLLADDHPSFRPRPRPRPRRRDRPRGRSDAMRLHRSHSADSPERSHFVRLVEHLHLLVRHAHRQIRYPPSAAHFAGPTASRRHPRRFIDNLRRLLSGRTKDLVPQTHSRRLRRFSRRHRFGRCFCISGSVASRSGSRSRRVRVAILLATALRHGRARRTLIVRVIAAFTTASAATATASLPRPSRRGSTVRLARVLPTRLGLLAILIGAFARGRLCSRPCSVSSRRGSACSRSCSGRSRRRPDCSRRGGRSRSVVRDRWRSGRRPRACSGSRSVPAAAPVAKPASELPAWREARPQSVPAPPTAANLSRLTRLFQSVALRFGNGAGGAAVSRSRLAGAAACGLAAATASSRC